MGRQAEFKNRKGITGYLELEEFNELEEIRWREHKDFSDILRLAVQEYIRNHKEGNDTFKLDIWQDNPEFRAIPTLLADSQKWFSHIQDSDREHRTQIAIAVSTILKQVNHIRKQKGESL